MKWKIFIGALIVIVGFLVGYSIVSFISKYHKNGSMWIEVTELTNFEYPDDPARLSTFYQRYNHRTLNLSQKDSTHFDFIFESPLPYVATISLKDLDLSLFIPSVPEWIKKRDRNLEILTLVEREWNRQQVSFTPHSKEITITGGDGYERKHLVSIELARNCLNAGLFELLLFTEDKGEKKLFYHGWFTFPLGHYKALFEASNNSSYWLDWFRLEHWISPHGKKMDLDKLRHILNESELEYFDFTSERIIALGEQENKIRTLQAGDVILWKDFVTYSQNVRFATFVRPGIYTVNKRWKNEYQRIAELEKVMHRRVRSQPENQELDEIELSFRNNIDHTMMRLVVSGINLADLPKLSEERYPEGLILPMGIAVPPFYQTYTELSDNPPAKISYFSALLDSENRWLDHHTIAIDGTILYRDNKFPNLIHLFLLSYERHTLISHYAFLLNQE